MCLGLGFLATIARAGSEHCKEDREEEEAVVQAKYDYQDNHLGEGDDDIAGWVSG